MTWLNPSRIAPVQEDLTQPNKQFEIVRGWEKMNRVDKAYVGTFTEGEWAVLGDNDKLTRPGPDAVQNTFLVFAGTDRTDVLATGKVGIVMNSKVIVRTTKRVAGETLHVGDPLNVKSQGTGNASLGKAGTGEPVLAYVTKLLDDQIEYATV